MSIRILAIILFILFASACASVTVVDKLPPSSGEERGTLSLATGKNFYVAMTGGRPENMDDTPDVLAHQFALFLAPMTKEVHSAKQSETRAEALAAAQNLKCDYLVLLHVQKWNRAFFFRPVRASVDAEILDVHSGSVLTRTHLETECSISMYGQENSPRECLRPQIDTWLSTLFSRPVSTPVHVSIPLLR